MFCICERRRNRSPVLVAMSERGGHVMVCMSSRCGNSHAWVTGTLTPQQFRQTTGEHAGCEDHRRRTRYNTRLTNARGTIVRTGSMLCLLLAATVYEAHSRDLEIHAHRTSAVEEYAILQHRYQSLGRVTTGKQRHSDAGPTAPRFQINTKEPGCDSAPCSDPPWQHGTPKVRSTQVCATSLGPGCRHV